MGQKVKKLEHQKAAPSATSKHSKEKARAGETEEKLKKAKTQGGHQQEAQQETRKEPPVIFSDNELIEAIGRFEEN